jgi:hypothetical protein
VSAVQPLPSAVALVAQPWPEAASIDTSGRADVALESALRAVDAEPE